MNLLSSNTLKESTRQGHSADANGLLQDFPAYHCKGRIADRQGLRQPCRICCLRLHQWRRQARSESSSDPAATLNIDKKCASGDGGQGAACSETPPHRTINCALSDEAADPAQPAANVASGPAIWPKPGATAELFSMMCIATTMASPATSAPLSATHLKVHRE